jgi:hypothetical protein
MSHDWFDKWMRSHHERIRFDYVHNARRSCSRSRSRSSELVKPGMMEPHAHEMSERVAHGRSKLYAPGHGTARVAPPRVA